MSTIKMVFLILSLFFMAGIVAAEDDMSIQLQSTFVGDKEQPSVSYFLPWQGMGSPDKLFRNIEGKNDDSLQPVDRDVLLRTMRMYNEMNLETPNNVITE